MVPITPVMGAKAVLTSAAFALKNMTENTKATSTTTSPVITTVTPYFARSVSASAVAERLRSRPVGRAIGLSVLCMFQANPSRQPCCSSLSDVSRTYLSGGVHEQGLKPL